MTLVWNVCYLRWCYGIWGAIYLILATVTSRPRRATLIRLRIMACPGLASSVLPAWPFSWVQLITWEAGLNIWSYAKFEVWTRTHVRKAPFWALMSIYTTFLSPGLCVRALWSWQFNWWRALHHSSTYRSGNGCIYFISYILGKYLQILQTKLCKPFYAVCNIGPHSTLSVCR